MLRDVLIAQHRSTSVDPLERLPVTLYIQDRQIMNNQDHA
jgi:hypothetical protein